MDAPIDALRSSVERLRRLVEPLDDDALVASAYPTEWTIADVLSHIGSGAVIMKRRVDDSVTGVQAADDFAPSVWDAWNAKSPRAQADDALAADAALLARIDELTDEQRAAFTTSLGPLTLDFDGFVALRTNEHAFHTWDIEVVADPAATLPPEVTAVVVDHLDLIARFTAKPTGEARSVVVRTTAPARDFTLAFTPDSVTMSSGPTDAPADLELPAEAFARLVYGRLDPGHTPAVSGEGSEAVLATLRHVFPGF